MKIFQWTVLRQFSGYVKVSRPNNFKIIQKPKDEAVSCSKVLHTKIKAGGPITVADYMKTVLVNPSIGYYMHKDMIGQQGDFVTSPEISQLFGETIAVWIYSEYKKLGAPKPWQIVEFGPGKGSLMAGILRSFNAFKATEGLSVHLVEVSSALSSIQMQNLCEEPVGIGMVQEKTNTPHYKSSTSQDVPIYWYEKLENVPKGFTIFLAHEFFDALPIHKFKKVPEGWREILINSTENDSGEISFNYVLSKNENVKSKLLIRENETRDHIEVCAEGGTLAGQIASRIEEFGGFALIMDYGHNGEKTDTFRGFKRHQLHDPLVNPGSADLTADVDFSFLREVMRNKLLTYGPVEQGDFLQRLGINIRLEMLLKHVQNEEEAKLIESGYHMIVDKDKMGSRYKFFAAFPSVLEEFKKPYPVEGFQ